MSDTKCPICGMEIKFHGETCTTGGSFPAPTEPALPNVAGRMEMTHEQFQRACQVMIGEIQETALWDNRLVHLLCEAVRCSRECCDLAC